MTAGERMFIDLLPDAWTGPPPSLPQEVVRELAERARAAERALRAAARGEAAGEAAPAPRAHLGAADLRAVRVRDAGRRRRVVGAERTEANAEIKQCAELRPGGCQGGRAAEHGLDQPEDRQRHHRGGNDADRRCRRALLPRGKELRDRRRLPAGRRSRAADALAPPRMPRMAFDGRRPGAGPGRPPRARRVGEGHDARDAGCAWRR